MLIWRLAVPGGPVVGVARHWVEVGVWIHCEPGACVLIAVRCRFWEDIVDSAGWVLWVEWATGARIDLGG
jgi:hypothetical protein